MQAYILLHKFAACQAADARLQLLQVKRLFHIIVGTCVQPLDLIGDLAARRQDYYLGFVVSPAQLAQDIHTVAPGQVQIQHDQVIVLRQDIIQRIIAVIAGVYLIACGIQAFGDGIAQFLFIFHDQQSQNVSPNLNKDFTPPIV